MPERIKVLILLSIVNSLCRISVNHICFIAFLLEMRLTEKRLMLRNMSWVGGTKLNYTKGG